jgi:acyl-CoA thioesterase
MDEKNMSTDLISLTEKEKFRKFLGIEVVKIENGCAIVSLEITDEMTNIYGFTHGGVIFSLADEAFELACNSRGYVEVGINVNISYTKPSKSGDTLFAKAKFVSESGRTAIYNIKISNRENETLAFCQAMSYKKELS